MNAKKKNKSLKGIEQLLEETKIKKNAILKILEKITKTTSKDETQD